MFIFCLFKNNDRYWAGRVLRQCTRSRQNWKKTTRIRGPLSRLHMATCSAAGRCWARLTCAIMDALQANFTSREECEMPCGQELVANKSHNIFVRNRIEVLFKKRSLALSLSSLFLSLFFVFTKTIIWKWFFLSIKHVNRNISYFVFNWLQNKSGNLNACYCMQKI